MFTSEKWSETKELIIGLYPKWNPTVEQAGLFRDKFSPLDQSAVQEAVKRMWLEDKFGSGQLSPGKLMVMYGKIKDEMAAVHQSHVEMGAEVSLEQERAMRECEEEASLRKILMLPIDVVRLAASKICRGLGRWSMFSKIRVDSENPNEWSFMGKCAVLYEIENPTDEGGTDANPEGNETRVDPTPTSEGVVGEPREPDSINLLDSL